MERAVRRQGVPRGLGARCKRGWADDDAHAHALRLLTARRHRWPPAAQPLRRDDQPAFVLHTYPYRETSLIVEAFTRGARPRRDGRARRQAPALGVARPAAGVPAAARCRGRAAASSRRCCRRNGAAGCRCSAARRSLCGFYLNELLLKLLPREDPHPRAVRRLRGGAGRAGRAAARAGAGAAPLRAAPARRAGLRAAARRARPTPARRSIPRARYHYAFDRGPRACARRAEPGAR